MEHHRDRRILFEPALLMPEDHQYDENINRAAAHADEIRSMFARQRALRSVMENGLLMVGLVKDYVTGAYRDVPYWVMGICAMALLYVLSPVDVIPDVIPGIGYLDDAAVVAFALKLIETELFKYKEWRAENVEKAVKRGK